MCAAFLSRALLSLLYFFTSLLFFKGAADVGEVRLDLLELTRVERHIRLGDRRPRRTARGWRGGHRATGSSRCGALRCRLCAEDHFNRLDMQEDVLWRNRLVGLRLWVRPRFWRSRGCRRCRSRRRRRRCRCRWRAPSWRRLGSGGRWCCSRCRRRASDCLEFAQMLTELNQLGANGRIDRWCRPARAYRAQQFPKPRRRFCHEKRSERPSTLAYAARQLLLVVISSLKLLISCCTWVRASPVSCDAAGNWVSSLSAFRAAVKCCLAAS